MFDSSYPNISSNDFLNINENTPNEKKEKRDQEDINLNSTQEQIISHLKKEINKSISKDNEQQETIFQNNQIDLDYPLSQNAIIEKKKVVNKLISL